MVDFQARGTWLEKPEEPDYEDLEDMLGKIPKEDFDEKSIKPRMPTL